MLTYQVGEEGHGASKIALFFFRRLLLLLLFLLPPPLFPSESYGTFLFIHKIVPQPEGQILMLYNGIFWFTGCG